jgi:hypothetical protein
MLPPSSRADWHLAFPWGHCSPPPVSPHRWWLFSSHVPWALGLRGGVGVFLLLFSTSSPLFLPSSYVKSWALNHSQSGSRHTPSHARRTGSLASCHSSSCCDQTSRLIQDPHRWSFQYSTQMTRLLSPCLPPQLQGHTTSPWLEFLYVPLQPGVSSLPLVPQHQQICNPGETPGPLIHHLSPFFIFLVLVIKSV